ncbi:MAG: nucleoside-diphosphate kinase [Acidimicrobiaceae bacterium]|nr:nucleoside-diphosphate kinase [Acidimicrobiaceae bacterium]
MKQTLIICKPDAVERGLVGEIISRFERKGLTLAAADLRLLDPSTLASHYSEHINKPFYGELEEFMTRGPVFVAIVEGPKETWRIVREMLGATNPQEAAPGTIRGDLATQLTENLVHGSDSAESAEREIKIFFPDSNNR